MYIGGHGQTCQQSLPSQYNPSSDPSVTTSNEDTFYLYPDFFNTAQCTGSVMNIQYEFCYLHTRNSQGPPGNVFTVLILRDEGVVYRILDSYTETEERNQDVCPTMSNTCCKTVSRPVSLTIQRELALGFVTPGSADARGNALYQSNTMSPGFIVNSNSVPSTTIGSTISRASFSGTRQDVKNQRFSVRFSIESSIATTTTASAVDTTMFTMTSMVNWRT